MDFLKDAASKLSHHDQNAQSGDRPHHGESSVAKEDNHKSGGGFMDKINNAMGGGKTGEEKEDLLDKGVDFIQQKFMGAGDQSNESAAEQAKDEMISDQIRNQFKKITGKDVPIKDKS